MKKLIVHLLILALLFTGCAEKATAVDPNEMILSDLKWNMSEQEVLEALSLADDDWHALVDAVDTRQQFYRIESMDVLGREARVYFEFFSYVDGMMGLRTIHVLYPDAVDFAKLKNDLAEQFGEPKETKAYAAGDTSDTWFAEAGLLHYYEKAYESLKDSYPENYKIGYERAKDTPIAIMTAYSVTGEHVDDGVLAHEKEELAEQYRDGCMLEFSGTVTEFLQYIETGGYPLPEA